MNRIELVERALRDLFRISRWHFDLFDSRAVAERWERACLAALGALCENPELAVVISENDRMPMELRQISFGSGRHNTHRAIVRFTEQAIVVIAIRHIPQGELRPEDLLG